ncbi:MAG: hypothetical protein R3D30_10165 [Hyphomicrobiales bacterium]
MLRSLPIDLTETVLATLATEFEPSATAFAAVACALSPKAAALACVAWLPVPTATLSSPLSFELPTAALPLPLAMPPSPTARLLERSRS